MKVITRDQYLQLLGLQTLAQKHEKIVSQCIETMNMMVGQDDVSGGASDVIYGERSLQWFLERAGFEAQG